MTEAEFEASLLDAAALLGYYRHAQRPARNGPDAGAGWRVHVKGEVGWPDVFLVGHGVAFAFELKSERGRIRPGQREWVELLDAVPGITARIVRPSDIDDVLELLTDARRRATSSTARQINRGAR